MLSGMEFSSHRKTSIDGIFAFFPYDIALHRELRSSVFHPYQTCIQFQVPHRGIQLTEFCKPEVPYLINVNEDGFRNNRFIYLIDKDQIIFWAGK